MAQINIKKTNSTNVATPPSGIQAIFIGDDGSFYTKTSTGDVSTLGISGTSGVNGATGPAGSAGSSGSSGLAGSSGTSGTSPTGGGGGAISLINDGTSGYGTLISNTIGATTSRDNVSIAIGVNANATNLYNDLDRGAIAIGENSVSNGRETIAIGKGAKTGQNSYAIGIGLSSGAAYGGVGDTGVSIGGSSAANNGVAVGYEARAQGASAIAIGNGNPQTYGPFTIAIGPAAGTYDYTWSDSSITIGAYARFKGDYTIAIGRNARAIAQGGIGIGYYATASHTDAVAIGSNTYTIVSNSTHVSNLVILNVPTYADNSAAISGGLIAGQVYRTSTGTLMIVY